jgi:hypothetical protein
MHQYRATRQVPHHQHPPQQQATACSVDTYTSALLNAAGHSSCVECYSTLQRSLDAVAWANSMLDTIR